MELETIKNWAELFSYIATIVGIPLAIIVYLKGKKQERKLKEKEALFASHSLYVDYLKICLENPELEIYDIAYKNLKYTSQNKKELIAFEILFAYLESAYHYYKDQSEDIKLKRWEGWVKYIRGYTIQKNFIEAWNLTGNEWDQEFMKFMNKIIEEQKQISKNTPLS
jgi:hypothetical protein